MDYITILLKCAVALSILNVWLLRRDKASQWRGGKTSSMEEEFAAYGLSRKVMIAVGVIKVTLSILLLASIFYPVLELISALGMAIMMTGAVAMHLKIKDPLKRALPAMSLLVLSVLIILL